MHSLQNRRLLQGECFDSQRLRTTGGHFQCVNKGETGERKKSEKGGGGGGVVKRGGGGAGKGGFRVLSPHPSPSLFSPPQFLPCLRIQNGSRSFVIAVLEANNKTVSHQKSLSRKHCKIYDIRGYIQIT